jgi:hypothetical protein
VKIGFLPETCPSAPPVVCLEPSVLGLLVRKNGAAAEKNKNRWAKKTIVRSIERVFAMCDMMNLCQTVSRVKYSFGIHWPGAMAYSTSNLAVNTLAELSDAHWEDVVWALEREQRREDRLVSEKARSLPLMKKPRAKRTKFTRYGGI